MSQEINHSEEQTRQYLVLDSKLIQQQTTSNDISLFEIWAVLFRKRILILGIFAVCLICSAIIAFLKSPVYQATIYFQSPLSKDVDVLNIPSLSSGYSADDVYETFQRNFRARDNLWEFFIKKRLYKAYLGENDYSDADILKSFDGKFLENMRLQQYRPRDNQDTISATFNWNDAVEGAALLNEYSETVSNKTIKQYVEELSDKLLLKKERSQLSINLLRASGQREKVYRLDRLSENITIAKELGIANREDLQVKKTSDVFVDASGKQPLYYQGYEALEAEKRTLLSRKNNDAFISGLNEKIKELEYLNSIKIPDIRISVVRVVQQAKALAQPIKPKKMLIVVLGCAIGLLLGIFAAFVANSVEGRE